IYVEGGQSKAVNSRFIDNRCYASGPDLGGGAIRALAQYENRPVYISHATFTGGRCSNGGALSSIQVQWKILDSVFIDNKARGWGANPGASGTPGGGNGGAVYIDGKNNDVLIAGTVMTGNSAREGGGAVFDVVNTGWGALTFNESHLHDNLSEKFETAPGIYYALDGKDAVPVMIKSTNSRSADTDRASASASLSASLATCDRWARGGARARGSARTRRGTSCSSIAPRSGSGSRGRRRRRRAGGPRRRARSGARCRSACRADRCRSDAG